MQNQHHIDEFSVTDVRHTLHEAWRVLVARRWFFLFPFCLVSTIACLASLHAPRTYSASTTIKREHDPVFASLKGKNWVKPYDEIRSRMAGDIADPNFVSGVLERAGLPVGLERFNDGSLTPAGLASRQALVSQIVAGLQVEPIESTENRDVVRITLTMSDASRIPDILRLLRESYIEHARNRTLTVLGNVHSFLKGEAERCNQEIARIQTRISEMETRFPGINPLGVDSLAAERTALVIERIDLRRRMDDVTTQASHLENQIAELKRAKEDQNSDEHRLVESPNPRYAELLNEIKGLEEKLITCRTRRGMTEAHPEVRAVRVQMEERGNELAQTTRMILAPAIPTPRAVGDSETLEELNARRAETVASQQNYRTRMETIESRLSEIEGQRVVAVEQRPAFQDLGQELKRAEDNLTEWRKDILPIENALNLENNGRSIHFATVLEPSTAIRPAAPDPKLVLLICFGAGMAAAVIAVLIAELCDRSYRTLKQVSGSLGIPVIESIDEIVTEATHRRRLLREIVLMPTLALILIITVSVAGVRAYSSLERPADLAEKLGVVNDMDSATTS